MKTKKKNRFLTFCFSWVPGAAEMYMGFMKSGVSLMVLFFAMVMSAVWINQVALAVFSIVVWFYGFFHANHLAGLSDEEFSEVSDEYLFGMDAIPGIKEMVEKYRSWVASALIFVGTCMLWNTVASLMNAVLPDQMRFIARAMWRIGDFAPSIVIGIVIIFVGIKLIRGKEAVVEGEQSEESAAVEQITTRQEEQ